MARFKNDYFKMIEEQVAFSAQASDLLIDIFNNYSPETISAQKQKMHEIENNADDLRHDIRAKLSREFITPIDQEDILNLVMIVDDVTDALDEVVIELYMFHVDKIPEDANVFVIAVNKCVKALQAAISELRYFKKPEKLHDLLVEVNTIESEADALYVEAIHNLYGMDLPCKQIAGYTAIFDCLEECCDLCEHASDVIEQTLMKNS